MGVMLLGFLGEIGLDTFDFRSREPACLCGTIGQKKIKSDAENARGQGFDNEQPLPARQTVRAMRHIQNKSRDRAADQAGHGNGGHEHRDDAAATFGRIPIGEVENDAREESGLCNAE